MLSQLTVDH